MSAAVSTSPSRIESIPTSVTVITEKDPDRALPRIWRSLASETTNGVLWDLRGDPQWMGVINSISSVVHSIPEHEAYTPNWENGRAAGIVSAFVETGLADLLPPVYSGLLQDRLVTVADFIATVTEGNRGFVSLRCEREFASVERWHLDTGVIAMLALHNLGPSFTANSNIPHGKDDVESVLPSDPAAVVSAPPGTILLGKGTMQTGANLSADDSGLWHTSPNKLDALGRPNWDVRMVGVIGCPQSRILPPPPELHF